MHTIWHISSLVSSENSSVMCVSAAGGSFRQGNAVLSPLYGQSFTSPHNHRWPPGGGGAVLLLSLPLPAFTIYHLPSPDHHHISCCTDSGVSYQNFFPLVQKYGYPSLRASFLESRLAFPYYHLTFIPHHALQPPVKVYLRNCEGLLFCLFKQTAPVLLVDSHNENLRVTEDSLWIWLEHTRLPSALLLRPHSSGTQLPSLHVLALATDVIQSTRTIRDDWIGYTCGPQVSLPSSLLPSSPLLSPNTHHMTTSDHVR